MNIVVTVLAFLCGFWLVQSLLWLVHSRNMRTLRDQDPPAPPEWPTVSVVVPARDEEATLEAAVRTRLAEDYPALEIVLVDDRSTDETPRIASRLVAEDPRVRTVRIETLPPGWLGKVHALEQGLAHASGEWVLFSDADVHMEPTALRDAIALCLDDGLDFLALVPEYDTGSRLVDVVWACFLRMLGIMIDARRVRDPSARTVIGSGAFNLVRREVFDLTPGFEWLRLETTDDIGLGMMMKRAGARCDLVDGRGSASVAIYPDLPAFFRGVEKNAGALVGPPRIVLALAGVGWLVLEWSPLIALGTGLAAGVGWLAALGAVTTAAATAINAGSLRRNTGRVLPALAWPLGSLLFAAAASRAVVLAYRNGGIRWRETFYPLEDLVAARRFRF